MNQSLEITVITAIKELNKKIYDFSISNKKFKDKYLKTLETLASIDNKISQIQDELQKLNTQPSPASPSTGSQITKLDKKLQLLQAKKTSLNKIADKLATFDRIEKDCFKLDSKINSRIVVEELVKGTEIDYPEKYSKQWFNNNFFKKEKAEHGIGVEFYKFYYEVKNNKFSFRLTGGEFSNNLKYLLSIDDEIDLSSLMQPPYELESNEAQQEIIFNALLNKGYINLHAYQNLPVYAIEQDKKQIASLEAEISKAKKDLLSIDLLTFEKDIESSEVYIEYPEIIKPLDKIIEIQIKAEELSSKIQKAKDKYDQFEIKINNSIIGVESDLTLSELLISNAKKNKQDTKSLEDDKIKQEQQLKLLKDKLEKIKSELEKLESNTFKEESQRLEFELKLPQPPKPLAIDDPAKIKTIEQQTEELETKLNAAKKALSTCQKEIKLSAVYCKIPETIKLTDKIIKSATKLEDLSLKIQELEKKVNPAEEKIKAKINEITQTLGLLKLKLVTQVSEDDKKPLQKTIDDLQKQFSLLSDKQNYLKKISDKLKNKSEKLITQKLKSELDDFYNKLLNNYSASDIDEDEKSLSELDTYIDGLEEDLKVWENGIKIAEVSVEYPEKQLYNKSKSNTYVEIRSKHDLRELQKQQKNYFRDEIIDAQTQKAQEHDTRMACSLEGEVISRSVAINSQEIKRSSYIFHDNSRNKKMWIDTSFSKSTNDGKYSIAKVDYFCSGNLSRAEQSECAFQYARQLLLHYDENDPKSTITLAVNKEHKNIKEAIEQANRVYAALLYLTSKKYVREHYINLPKEKLIIKIPGVGPKFFDDPLHKNPLTLQENFIKEHTSSYGFDNRVADFMEEYKAFRASNKNETEKDINREYIRPAK